MGALGETVWRPAYPVDLVRTLAPLARGRRDPTHQVRADGSLWRTSLTPAGPVTARLSQRSPQEIACQAWGPGAEWALAGVPDLLGARDRPEDFDPRTALLAAVHRRNPWLRMPRTGRVFEALAPAVLEQKVTALEAKAAFRRLVLRFGSTAPGPAPLGMAVPPPPEVWQRIPSWEWHRAGVQPPQSRALVTAARVAGRLEEAAGMAPDAAEQRLRSVPGIGPWTAAEVAQRAMGDPDSVSVGDFHLSQFVGWALIGRPVDDAGMLELLEPWRGHRQRVVRLLALSGAEKPKFAPRLTIADHRAI